MVDSRRLCYNYALQSRTKTNDIDHFERSKHQAHILVTCCIYIEWFRLKIL